MAVLEHRVSRLEEVLAHFIESTEAGLAASREEMAEFRAANARTDREILRLRRDSEERWKRFEQQAEKDRQESDERWQKFEQQADKDRQESNERWQKFEQQADKDRQESNERWQKFEQQADKNRQQADKDREEADKDRQQADKDRQQADKDREEADKDRRAFNKRMAEISDRVGRFVEDMVHPNAARIAGKLFGKDPIETLAIRVKRKHPQDASRMIEVDLLVAGSQHLLIGEAKSTPTVEKADAFLKKVAEIYDFFPEYAGRKVLPLLASVSFETQMVAYLSRKKVYALGFGDETMELLNEGVF